MSTLRIVLLMASLFPCFVENVRGEIRLNPVFGSNMVLQRDVAATLAGWADEGERVTVKLGNQVVGKAVGAGKGKAWSVALPVFKAGPLLDITVEGGNTIVLTNLLAGDVWICSGQSNMEMALAKGPWCPYGGVLDAEKEVTEANYPEIRLVISTGGKNAAIWQPCSPEFAKKFSATAYFFGRKLWQDLKVPIGLVQAAVGGTCAEYWTPLAARKAWPSYEVSRELAVAELKKIAPAVMTDRKAQAEWIKAVEAAKANGTRPLPRPVPRITGASYTLYSRYNAVVETGRLYESRVRPFTACRIKGAIWYQGEGNAIAAAEYADLMQQLIAGWREDWGQGDFPFLIMQLVSFASGTEGWPELRAAQQAVVDAVPNTGLAVGVDIGDPKNIHPANKQEVGRRLALIALKQVYGRDVIASGPKPTTARFESGKAMLAFDQRLVLKGNTGFELAGKDGKFLPATVEADENMIKVTASSVPEPHDVRYAWQPDPVASVYNSAGLPAAPFQKRIEGETRQMNAYDPKVLPKGHEYFDLRDGLANCQVRFEREKTGRIAFLGGSITQSSGWRDHVIRYFQEKFPGTKFDFVSAGISSLGSVPHAFRLERDVLSRGPVDLLFVEAAVNDASNIPDHPEQMLRGLEGVVRHARLANPLTDIVHMHFAMPGFLADYGSGRTPVVIEQHETVAAAYGNPSLNLAREVTERIAAGEFSWKKDFKDLHPSPFGHQLYANSMARMLDAAFGQPPGDAAKPHRLPSPVDAGSYFRGRFGTIAGACKLKGFVLEKAWRPTDGKMTRPGFVDVPALVGTAPGAEFEYPFAGTVAGLFITSGPDAGRIEFSVDGGPWRTVETFTPWSAGLHLPWVVILDDELGTGPHAARVRIIADRHPNAAGTALRVLHFLVNNEGRESGNGKKEPFGEPTR